MSLDLTLHAVRRTEVGSFNITHNLAGMATELGVYGLLWRPEEHGIKAARQLIQPVRDAIRKIESDPWLFRQYDAKNGWGTTEHMTSFLHEVLCCCERHPDAEVSAYR